VEDKMRSELTHLPLYKGKIDKVGETKERGVAKEGDRDDPTT
jgi:hypothetical protein